MKRTDLQDVSLDVYRLQLKKLRSMTADKRLQAAIERTLIGYQIHRLAIHRIKERSA